MAENKFKNPKRANNLSGSEWTRYSISVWSDIKKSSEERKLKHPAMFPEMLVNRLIRCFTTEKDKIVLDPFMGTGSAVLAARNLNKIGIGFELNKDYIREAESRVSQQQLFSKGGYKFYNEDANSIPDILDSESVHFCITSPPYWDILSQKRTADYKKIRDYGDNKKDLAKISDYHEFINALGDVFKGVYEVLIPEKYCIINVMDLRKKNQFFPYHADVASMMQKIGFIFDDIIVWDRRQEYNNLRSLGYPYVFRINKIHEFILIFQKPKTSSSASLQDKE